MGRIMKKIFRKVVNRIKKWNEYWAFIEEQRMECMKHSGRGQM